MDLYQIEQLNKKFAKNTSLEVIEYFTSKYQNNIAFATSLGLEDQIIIQMIASLNKNIKIFTLDTGRIFPETYDLIEKTQNRYKVKLEIYFPKSQEVEKMVNEKGINLFYKNIENRKLCCGIRKIEPLKRALTGIDFWISGLRRGQSPTRTNVKMIEWDSNNSLTKISPLINWEIEDCWDYIKKNNIPYNTLNDKGFLSIGCQPCTRAISPGESFREGRWWWENPTTKECGLHQK